VNNSLFWTQLDPDWVSDAGVIRPHRLADAAVALKEWLEAHVVGNNLKLHTQRTEDNKPDFLVPARTHFIRRSWVSMHALLTDLMRAMKVKVTTAQVREVLTQTALLGALSWEQAIAHPADKDQVTFSVIDGETWAATTWPLSLEKTIVAIADNEAWCGVDEAPVVDQPGADPNACPEFRQWLVDRWPQHHEAVLDIMAECRVLGLLGLGGASERAVSFMGPADGGKTATLNIITHNPDGTHMTARVTPHTVSDPVHRFEVMKARWAVIDDDDYDWDGIKDFKALLSPYPILQRTLYERPEKVGNKSLLLMASNQPPPFGAAACEDATYKRFVLVPPPVPVPESIRVRGWEQGLLDREGPSIRRLLWERGWPAVRAWVAGTGKLFTSTPYNRAETRHLWLLNSAPFYRDIICRKFIYTGNPADVLKCAPLIAELSERAFEKDPVTRGRLGNLGYLLQALARAPQAVCSYPDEIIGVKRRPTT